MKRLIATLLLALLPALALAQDATHSIIRYYRPSSAAGGGVALGDTNAWTGPNSFIDTNFTIIGSADPTKALRFEVDGFTTGTRIITFQNANHLVAGTNFANTFTSGQTFNAGLTIATDQNIGNGTTGGLTFRAAQTPDTLLLFTGSASNNIVVAEAADVGFDFAHPLQTNPTLFIHSANQSTTQWLGLSHDATNSVLETGAGAFRFNTVGVWRAGISSSVLAVSAISQIGFHSATNLTAVSADAALARYGAGVLNVTDGTSTTVRGFLGGGTAVASAAALPLPTGRVFHVTGTTNVTSITSTNFASGAVITLIFDGILTFTDGGNLVLAGNFVTTANDTITLVYDGTSWFETGRAIN